jgi:DNA-binding winged helix-turn-helix (wHTH) protein
MEKSEERVLSKMKEVKETVDQNMLNNFRSFDERLDQFSQLVDVNLDTLRKAIQDNRHIFISTINKVNDDFNLRTSSFVDDLMMIQYEITETSSAMQMIEEKAD